MMRIILDTNVWLSGIFWRGKPGIIIDRIFSGETELMPVFSAVTLAELESKIRKRYPYRLIHRIRSLSLMVANVPSTKIKVRDPNDQILVDLCIAAKVSVLITGDKDLLVLKKIGRTRVVTPSEFVLMLSVAKSDFLA